MKKLRISKQAQNNVLIELLQAVKDGREFPDAHTSICVKYKLNDEAAERLTEEYDRLADQFT